MTRTPEETPTTPLTTSEAPGDAPADANASRDDVLITDERRSAITIDDRAGAVQAAVQRPLPTIDPTHYELGFEIAHGGMGRIRVARDLRLDREVAIKELLDASDRHGLRFELEARVTARLQHPAIVSVYEAGRWPSGEPFYAMKLVHGRSLKSVIAQAHSFDERVALLTHAIAVADAMAYAHQQRIIHRDLKPANVLVGEFGETVVIDWGLAKDLAVGDPRDDAYGTLQRSSDPKLTRAGTVMGTPTYMPPEQARGEPVDERADVYAIGAMLYHLLSGHPPFVGDSSEAVIAQVVAEAPVPLWQREPRVALDLQAIVARAMERDASKRYPTARELAEDLRRFQTGQLVASHRYSRGELIRRFVIRHRVPIGATVAALALVAAIGAVSLARIRGERDVAERARANADVARGLAVIEKDTLIVASAKQLLDRDPAAAMALLATLSPGSTMLGAARIVASDARARHVPMIGRGHEDKILCLVASGDGERFATGSADRSVRVWNARTLEGRVIGRHVAAISSIAFSPDGRAIAAASADRVITVWPIDGGAPVSIQQPAAVNALVYSVDGSQLVTAGDDGVVRFLRLPGGEVTRTIDVMAWALQITADGRWLAAGGRLFDLETGTSREPLSRPAGYPAGAPWHTHVVLAPTGTRALAHANLGGNELAVWDLATRQKASIRESVLRAAFSPDGNTIAVLGFGSLRLHHGAGPETLAEPSRDNMQVPMLAFAPDGRALATFGNIVQVWDRVGHDTMVLRGPRSWLDHPDAHAFGLRGATAVVAVGNDLWSWSTRRRDRTVATHFTDDFEFQPAYQVAYLSDGRLVSSGKTGRVAVGDLWLEVPHGLTGAVAVLDRRIAAIGTDGKVRLIGFDDREVHVLEGTVRVDAREPHEFDSIGRTGRAFAEANGWTSRIVASPDHSTLAASDARGGLVHVWDLATGTRRTTDTAAAVIEHLAFVRDDLLVVAGSDGMLRLIDVASGATRAIAAHEGPIEAIAIAPDRATIATAGFDRTIRWWTVATGHGVVLGRHRATPSSVAFSPDGRHLVSGGDDKIIQLWHLPSRQPTVIAAAAEPVFFAFSPDGKSLAVSEGEFSIELFDIETRVSRLLTGSFNGLGPLAWSPDGNELAVAHYRGHVRTWPDDLPRDEARLRAWIERPTLD